MLDQHPLFPTALIDFPATSSDATQRQRLHFRHPRQWLVAHDAHQVPALLEQAHKLSMAGSWCIGWISYESAPAFDPHLPVKACAPGKVYAVWAVFDEALEGWPDLPDTAPQQIDWQLSPWVPDMDGARQVSRMAQIQELIRAGEVYQVNLTTAFRAPLELPDTLSPDSHTLHQLFRALHRSQPNGYGLFLDNRTATRSPGAVLSVSPELFFDWDGEKIVTRPMKGTAPRHVESEKDQAQADHLLHSEKERAENLMIVDLLRNDLSRVAQVGSVQVDALFEVQALPTVWQMTSTISAQTLPGTTLTDVFRALFPCGSVTGAPKQRAMHHISRLEAQARGVYCGAVGMLAPGGHARFNVPIRTVCMDTPAPQAPWKASCGIGSGITLDAQIDAEQQEWHHKQAFLHRASKPFDLLESLQLTNGQFARLDLHLQRLKKTAHHFGFTTEDASTGHHWSTWEASIHQALHALALAHPAGTFKVRLLLSAAGRIQLQHASVDGPMGTDDLPTGVMTPPIATVVLAQQPMAPADDFVRHKTTRREAYQGFIAPADAWDTLLFNASGELTEFTIGNVAVRVGGQWLTPPAKAGLLPGVMRESLLRQGHLREAPLTVSDLNQAEGLVLLNSVRGCVPVCLTHQGISAAQQ